MGNTTSSPDSVYRAVKARDHREVVKLCRELSSSTPEQRKQYLEWQDEDGRTPLMLAAQKDLYSSAKELLDQGANLCHIASKRRLGGSALHEAVAQRSDSMVELLLQRGADPFREDGCGDTSWALAVMRGKLQIMRTMERYALFAGWVNMKVSGDRENDLKDRWLVITPQCSLPAAGKSTVRFMLWVFQDKYTHELCTKVCLDGASTYGMGADRLDGVVHLHPKHKVLSKYTRVYGGYMLFFRPCSSPTGHGDFAAFMDTCSRPFALWQQRRGALSTVGRPPGAVPSEPTPCAELYPSGAGAGLGAAGAAAPLVPQQSLQPAASGAVAVPAGFLGGGAAPAPAAEAQLGARQGESDADFARRLAALYGTLPANAVAAGPPHDDAPSAPWTDADPSAAPMGWLPRLCAVPAAARAVSPAACGQAATMLAASEEGLCLICMSAPKEVGFLHGSTLHKCVCAGCARSAAPGQPCYVCRAPIERIIGVYE